MSASDWGRNGWLLRWRRPASITLLVPLIQVVSFIQASHFQAYSYILIDNSLPPFTAGHFKVLEGNTPNTIRLHNVYQPQFFLAINRGYLIGNVRPTLSLHCWYSWPLKKMIRSLSIFVSTDRVKVVRTVISMLPLLVVSMLCLRVPLRLVHILGSFLQDRYLPQLRQTNQLKQLISLSGL